MALIDPYELLRMDKDEKIIEEFNCFLVESLPILGKLYLAENHICFYSNIIFFNRNISIPLGSILKIDLNNFNIELESKEKDNITKKYKFFSNDNIKIIYEKIKYLIPKPLSDLESSETDVSGTKSRKYSDSSSNSLLDEPINNNDLLIVKSDEEINFPQIDPNLDIEIYRKIININPKKLFNKYYSSSTNFQKFYEWMGNHSNIKISDWEKINTEEKGIDVEKFKKIENFMISLKGVPFVDHSEIYTTSIYYIENDGTYYINNSTKSEGIPFADCFTIEATIELHPYINNTKTIFRTYIRINFLKSTFLKNILISQTKKNYIEEIDKWFEFIQEKGEKVEGDYIRKEKLNFTNDKINYNDNNETLELIKKNTNEKKEEISVYNISFKKSCKKYRILTYISIILILYLFIFYFLYIKY